MKLFKKSRDKGSITLEFVGTFAIYLFLVALAFQAMLAMFSVSQANTAARNAARAEVLQAGAGQQAAYQAVSPGLRETGVNTSCSGSRGPKGEIKCEVSLGMPIFNFKDAPDWAPKLRVSRSNTQPMTEAH